MTAVRDAPETGCVIYICVIAESDSRKTLKLQRKDRIRHFYG